MSPAHHSGVAHLVFDLSLSPGVAHLVFDLSLSPGIAHLVLDLSLSPRFVQVMQDLHFGGLDLSLALAMDSPTAWLRSARLAKPPLTAQAKPVAARVPVDSI